ncbi:ParB N-terminal domain-containing protein [Sediminibacterium soli]|uniref:ParB N-terminal domain-containing protein n=1 Tax=Sediminibacterium soli TaxID=2698829 RepID=UPI00137A2FDE|nr:ParB N-terminal domain-containing protein [Sediminibacterium soli]NCI46148.1 hypothetical protein [Sediminibacterium soli]
MTKIEQIELAKLRFDTKNPRLFEFGINEASSEEDMIGVLCKIMSVKEIVLSIYNSGFFENEPLVAVKNDNEDSFTVIEGNRRLAAIKVITEYAKYTEYYPSQIPPPSEALIKSLQLLPVMVEESREKSWQFIGFKHVNGALKWTSFAKAQYIAHVHNDFGVPLNAIALQIGDSNKIAQRLYQALMVLTQAEDTKVFNRANIYPTRLYFSHLYTGLQYEGVKDFIGLKDVSEEVKDPVQKVNELGELLTWMYGNKMEDTKPIIQSQNPDLRNLDSVLKVPAAIETLRSKGDLSVAYENSQPDDSKFFQSLNDSKLALYKALQYVATGYKGDEEKLRMSGTIADMSDQLYSTMESIYSTQAGNSKKQRLTEK